MPKNVKDLHMCYYHVITTLSFFSNEHIENFFVIVMQENIHELFYEIYENI